MRDEVSSVRIADTQTSTETDVPCTRIIITAGAWSRQVFSTLFPTSDLELPVTSLAGHSLIVRSPRWTKEHEAQGCHALFLAEQPGYSPEIFSRVGGQIYLAGVNSADEPLPALASDAQGKRSPAAIARLRETACALLGETEADLDVVREALCFRPATASGLPIIDRIADRHLGPGVTTRPGSDGGVFLAAGHGPWGISQSLGTGKCLAELVQGRTLSADISRLGLAV